MVAIEVCRGTHSTSTDEELSAAVSALLLRLKAARSVPFVEGEVVNVSSDMDLAGHVSHLRVCDVEASGEHIYVHTLDDEEPAEETTEGGDGDTVAFQMWSLPSTQFDGLWESLLFDEEEAQLKRNLLRYVETAMHFSDVGVDPRIISCNRLVMLHGPPGTGKTSICKGLAQKLAIRLGRRYPLAHLIEVNAHSLFSKWFSESGKMVMGMFQRITEMLEDGDALVCVLIDEVESLTRAREAAMSSNEPSDAVRVVNALLTQLDGLKRFPNALVLTTSNIASAVDPAFVDRADIKQYVGPPGTQARYAILSACIVELQRSGVMKVAETPLPWNALLPLIPKPPVAFDVLQQLCDGGVSSAPRHSLMLHALAASCDGISGRALRKLPFLAHALFFAICTM